MFFTTDDCLTRLLLEETAQAGPPPEGPAISEGRASLVMRPEARMTLCGTEEAARVFALLGLETDLGCTSGSVVMPGQILLTATGPAAAILAAQQVARNLVGWASGVASAAARIVAAARSADPDAVVGCTRQTTPGMRALSIKAAVAGGAIIHRPGLTETRLLFPEYRWLYGPEGLALHIARLRARFPERRVMIDVSSAAEAVSAAAAGAEVIQLEHFTPQAVAETRAAIGPDWTGTLVAAGGVDETNAAAYAAGGARLLVTSAPYRAAPAALAVEITRA